MAFNARTIAIAVSAGMVKSVSMHGSLYRLLITLPMPWTPAEHVEYAVPEGVIQYGQCPQFQTEQRGHYPDIDGPHGYAALRTARFLAAVRGFVMPRPQMVTR
jgi:hypothetical protein